MLDCFTYIPAPNTGFTSFREALSSWILARICLQSFVKLRKEAEIAPLSEEPIYRLKNPLHSSHMGSYSVMRVMTCAQGTYKNCLLRSCEDDTAGWFFLMRWLEQRKAVLVLKEVGVKLGGKKKHFQGCRGTEISQIDSSGCRGGWKQSLIFEIGRLLLEVLTAWGHQRVWSKLAAKKSVSKASRCYFGPIGVHIHSALISKLFICLMVCETQVYGPKFEFIYFLKIMLYTWQFHSFDWCNNVYREHSVIIQCSNQKSTIQVLW